MPSDTRADRAACMDNPTLFQHPLLEEPAQARQSSERQHKAILLAGRAATVCAECPLFNSCLYDAVVNHDVAGFAAGTTEAQRSQIRGALKVRVEPEEFDTLAGVVRAGRQVDHVEVVRLRQANPDETLETIAMRLGCSLSTVKRHLRRARADAGQATLAVVKPTLEAVLAAFAAVVGYPRRGTSERRVA